jgi:hypothetical protein
MRRTSGVSKWSPTVVVADAMIDECLFYVDENEYFIDKAKIGVLRIAKLAYAHFLAPAPGDAYCAAIGQPGLNPFR